MHAWLQAMHVSTSAASPRPAFATISGSARNGRAIETKSTLPAASTSSAAARLLMRLLAITGSAPTASFTAAANLTQTPLGTTSCTVGIDDSCQPMPTLSASTPSSASALANASVSAGVVESFIKSAPEMRKMIGKSVPTLAQILAQHRARQLHPAFEIAAPGVVAAIRQRREELIEEISLRRHHFDRVESQLARARRAARKVVDRFENLRFLECARRIG